MKRDIANLHFMAEMIFRKIFLYMFNQNLISKKELSLRLTIYLLIHLSHTHTHTRTHTYTHTLSLSVCLYVSVSMCMYCICISKKMCKYLHYEVGQIALCMSKKKKKIKWMKRKWPLLVNGIFYATLDLYFCVQCSVCWDVFVDGDFILVSTNNYCIYQVGFGCKQSCSQLGVERRMRLRLERRIWRVGGNNFER